MNKKFPQIKKDVKKFLLSEEGKVNKKKVFKMEEVSGSIPGRPILYNSLFF